MLRYCQFDHQEIQRFFSFTEMHLKVSSAKWRPFCPGDELRVSRNHTCWYYSWWTRVIVLYDFTYHQNTLSILRLHMVTTPYHTHISYIYILHDAKIVCHVSQCFRQEIFHDDVIKWKHFPRNWPFVRGIHRSPVDSPHKSQWRGALMFYLICA